jgi:hypothetical protein
MEKGEAIQIITFDKKTKEIKILEKNFEVFKNFQKPIYALSTFGTSKMGKSTLNNLILDDNQDKNNAFGVSNSSEACTLGIWVWSKPILLPNNSGSFILIDTEGTEKGDTEYLAKVIGISTIISSVQIFNVSKDFNNSSLANLSIISSIVNLVDGNRRESRIFPHLCIVIRDSQLVLKINNEEVTNEEYLQYILDPNDDGNDTIRKDISGNFSRRTLFRIERPINDDLKDLNNLKTGKFKTSFEAFKKQLFKIISNNPKKVAGLDLDGESYGNFVLETSKMILSQGKIKIETTSTLIHKFFAEKLMKEAYQIYLNSIEEIFSENKIDLSNVENIPNELMKLDHKKLEKLQENEIFEKSRKLSLEYFEKNKGNLRNDVYQEYEEILLKNTKSFQTNFNVILESIINSQKLKLSIEEKKKYDEEIKKLNEEKDLNEKQLEKLNGLMKEMEKSNETIDNLKKTIDDLSNREVQPQHPIVIQKKSNSGGIFDFFNVINGGLGIAKTVKDLFF